MSTRFAIPSSDPALLEQATGVAETFARKYVRDGIVGIVFLGAIARGYYDTFADIDISLYKTQGVDIQLAENYQQEQGFEIDCSLADYAEEAEMDWDMAKRWAFTTHRIFYDPDNLLEKLFIKKVVLRAEERRWLMIEGMTQSDWYIDTLPRMWVARGNLVSAMHMFDEGLTFFFNALFGLNNELVADVKWRYFCAEQLPVLPPQFHERIREVLLVKTLTEADIDRRREAFMVLWRAVLPWVEEEVKMPYEEFSKLV